MVTFPAVALFSLLYILIYVYYYIFLVLLYAFENIKATNTKYVYTRIFIYVRTYGPDLFSPVSFLFFIFLRFFITKCFSVQQHNNIMFTRAERTLLLSDIFFFVLIKRNSIGLRGLYIIYLFDFIVVFPRLLRMYTKICALYLFSKHYRT